MIDVNHHRGSRQERGKAPVRGGLLEPTAVPAKERLLWIVGGPKRPRGGLADGDWRAHLELKAWRGLIGMVGHPPRLQAVVHDEHQAIHFIGYASEAEVARVVGSFRSVAAK